MGSRRRRPRYSYTALILARGKTGRLSSGPLSSQFPKLPKSPSKSEPCLVLPCRSRCLCPASPILPCPALSAALSRRCRCRCRWCSIFPATSPPLPPAPTFTLPLPKSLPCPALAWLDMLAVPCRAVPYRTVMYRALTFRGQNMHVSMRVDERNTVVLKICYLVSPKVIREKRFRSKKLFF